jgi:hypothetical protein
MNPTSRDNPLSSYFRQPAIYIRLPSDGKFYPPDTLETTANNEFPVLAMTTMDEITYRTPDALFNGSAVASVIESCLPNIKNAWALPAIDIDAILIAIRIATYGHEMELSTKCPSCEHEANYGLDLRIALDQIKSPDYTKTIHKGDLELFFRPMNYQQLNENNKIQFEEQKVLQIMEDQDSDQPTKIARMSEVLKNITQITIGALAQSISAIKTPQTTVTDPRYINEWLANCDRGMFTEIKNHILDTKRVAELQPLDITCTNCQHQYQQFYTLDMTNFFEAAS